MTPRTATPFARFGERDTALNKRIHKSLHLQLLCAVLISFAVGLAAFAIAFFLGEVLLDQTVYGQTFAETMADQHFSQLQEYVDYTGPMNRPGEDHEFFRKLPLEYVCRKTLISWLRLIPGMKRI